MNWIGIISGKRLKYELSMIKQITIQNFQVHSKLRIDPETGITSIIGSSDTGKSSIVRALAWVAFNHPPGLACIRDGSEGCSVSIQVDGHVVKKRRSKRINHYEVDGKKLEAIRKGEVPEEVTKLLGLDRLNFQFQHDSPLWLSSSAGQVAKDLNEIVSLDLIDRVLTRINKQARTAATELNISENRLEKAVQDLNELEWIKEADGEYSQIEEYEESIERVDAQHIQLLGLIQSIDKSTKEIKELAEVIQPLADDLDRLQSVKLEIQVLEQESSSLLSEIDHLDGLESDIAKLNGQISHIKEQIDSVESCPVCGKPF